jgi:ATP-dependent exoDNAse (exonuclease V) beta subunit
LSVEDLLSDLDDEQIKAVTMETNGVVTAGAGSGKTRVLASRYAWLVMEKKLKPEEILTLTFTNKAVSEMYSRIYRYLLDQANLEAAKALENFHKAKISTLDSFSANVARTAAARYGISPDFSSDDAALRSLAREAALRFVLDHREAPAIRQLLVDHKIKSLAEEIFARVVLNYSPISSPLDLNKDLASQKKEIIRVWQEKVQEITNITGLITDALHTLAELKKSISLTKNLGDILLESPPPPLPDISLLLETSATEDIDYNAELPPSETRLAIKKYFDYYSAVIAARIPGRYGDDYTPLVEYFKRLKGKDGDGLFHELEAIANYAFNFGLCAGIFELVKKFQDEFNAKKRETGFLSFNDIARLAVDALKDHPDIRKAYKDSLRMIMIDEFQDNNSLQRDLIYLLAENSGRTEKGIAQAEELENNRMFFVGDEKQSIYRFRGADVAVFRSLIPAMGSRTESIELLHNYRSQPNLISAFNFIFRDVFLQPGPSVPDYEAAYNSMKPPEYVDRGVNSPLAHFCFLNGDSLPSVLRPKDDTSGIKSQDLEAVFIAARIRDMVRNREKIPKRNDKGIVWVECAWGDFAVLERSYTHQSTLEKHFREFGIPYNTDRPTGLFNDAPILDTIAFLRLLVYPEDRIAYAALIRSPFMRLSDLSLAVCMLSIDTNTGTPGKSHEPFAEENEALIPENERILYRRARTCYRSLREASRTLPVTGLLTKLWFEEGYRYETLWTESVQVYESLFDLFFSLAAECDAKGKSLADFIEYLEDVMNREEKPDDKDIPGEGEGGVRIMSIHKCKGLEFPVVFIYDCSHAGNIRRSTDLLSYHQEYGLVLNIPQAEELPFGGNYFRQIMEEEERAKDIAELRRLLYVAMTRAEYKLFLTFTLPPQTIPEKKDWDTADEEFTDETIRRRLSQLDEKSEGKRDNFLKLLAGILHSSPASLCALEAIPLLTRDEIKKAASEGRENTNRRKLGNNQKEAALAAETFYNSVELLREGKAAQPYLAAGKLRYRLQGSGKVLKEYDSDDSALDRLLEKTDLAPEDFGSLVHAILESRLKGQPFVIPTIINFHPDDEKAHQSLLALAQSMADSFLSSALGKRWAPAHNRNSSQSEFPVITAAVTGAKAITIFGIIDLLFEEDDEVVIIDFKTDRIENPEDHYGQLAAYYRAAGDIYGKPVSLWLFYLRSGSAVNVTEEVKVLSLEELAAQAMAE